MPGYFYRSRWLCQLSKFIFCRKQCLFAVLLCLSSSCVCYAQREQIEALKSSLVSLQGTAHVDVLNNLSLAYTYLHADTAEAYAQKAHDLATSIFYTGGVIMSLNNSAHIAGLASHNFPLQEKISLQVINQYKKVSNEKVLIETYINLSLALFCQSQFRSCAATCAEIIRISKKNGDNRRLGEAIAMTGCIDLETGNYEKAFENFNQSLEIFRRIKDSFNVAILLAKVGDLYRLAGDDKTALGFYYQSLEYPKGPSMVWHPLVDLGDTYYALEQHDPASNEREEYMHAIKSLTIRSNNKALSTLRMSEIQIASKHYDDALRLLSDDLKNVGKTDDKNYEMRLLLDAGRIYQGKKNYQKAFYYAKALLQNAHEHRANQYIRDGYKLMYILYEKSRKIDSAYLYYRKYTETKDSVALDEFGKKLGVYKAASENQKKQGQIEALNKEKIISRQQLQISGQQLASESFQKNMLIAGVLILIILGTFIFRNITLKQKNEANRHEIMENELHLQKLEDEKAKGELLQQATELEMQSLRAQMNPHFIFNSLNSINLFIMQNNKAKASEFLTKFSRLVRLILQNSQSPLISLEAELEALELYLELEALRFNYHFKFEINVDADISASVLRVPPLIIQPYVENAIWHGLMHKEAQGNLKIDLYEQENMLFCKIVDDGIGRKKAGQLKNESNASHKSMGMQITANRIAKLEKNIVAITPIEINDLILPDGSIGGTEVLLKIPLFYD